MVKGHTFSEVKLFHPFFHPQSTIDLCVCVKVGAETFPQIKNNVLTSQNLYPNKCTLRIPFKCREANHTHIFG